MKKSITAVFFCMVRCLAVGGWLADRVGGKWLFGGEREMGGGPTQSRTRVSNPSLRCLGC